MKVLKLHVGYDGHYGGSVDEYVLLPLEVNGVLFEELSVGNHEREVYLGEIEGKHSEVYGDLEVEIIDLNDLDIKTANCLINNSSDGEFECYFEGIESEYREHLESKEIDYEDKIKPVVDKYNLELSSWSIVSVKVHEKFIEELKRNYVTKFKTITILEKDYNEAIGILHNSGIESY